MTAFLLRLPPTGKDGMRARTSQNRLSASNGDGI